MRYLIALVLLSSCAPTEAEVIAKLDAATAEITANHMAVVNGLDAKDEAAVLAALRAGETEWGFAVTCPPDVQVGEYGDTCK